MLVVFLRTSEDEGPQQNVMEKIREEMADYYEIGSKLV
jgi:hypothetical protein